MAFNPDYCAACGSIGEVHEHHLVPRAHDGDFLPTVFLCLACHGAVHGRRFDPRARALQRDGIAIAKFLDKYKGRTPDTDRHAKIADMLKSGMSYSAIQAATGCGRATVAKVARQARAPSVRV
jgi:hypothetical protein